MIELENFLTLIFAFLLYWSKTFIGTWEIEYSFLGPNILFIKKTSKGNQKYSWINQEKTKQLKTETFKYIHQETIWKIKQD